jgi:hypothetical protein
VTENQSIYFTMDQLVCLFFLLMFSLAANAGGDFAQRVTMGDKLAATPAGQAYQQKLNALLTPEVVGFMLKKCSMTTGLAPMDFTLVANISAFRTLQNYQEEPENKLTRCFGARLTSVCFPWISAIYKESGYPVVMRIQADVVKSVVIKKGERLHLNDTCPGY